MGLIKHLGNDQGYYKKMSKDEIREKNETRKREIWEDHERKEQEI